jgi:hypothetical protein
MSPGIYRFCGLLTFRAFRGGATRRVSAARLDWQGLHHSALRGIAVHSIGLAEP